MQVENPLELQMIFGDRVFLDDTDTVVFDARNAEENQPESIENHRISILPIAFFLDLQKTRSAGYDDIKTLLGKMLTITQMEGKVPTMELAEVYDFAEISEAVFIELVKKHKKIVVFTEDWPFDQIINGNFGLLNIGNVQLLITPSISLIMKDMEVKTEFAKQLKQYFVAS